MEVNWSSIRNHPISPREKPRKVSNPAFEEKVTFAEHLEDFLEEHKNHPQKKKYKESKIDYEI